MLRGARTRLRARPSPRTSIPTATARSSPGRRTRAGSTRRPAATAAHGLQVSDFALTGWMWSENAGWISLSCENTGTCGTASYGVKNNGHGRLERARLGRERRLDQLRVFGRQRRDRRRDRRVQRPRVGREHRMDQLLLREHRRVRHDGLRHQDRLVPVDAVGPDRRSRPSRVERWATTCVLSQLTLGGGAAWHEIVRGSLSVLRGSGGDFAAATIDCAGDDVTGRRRSSSRGRPTCSRRRLLVSGATGQLQREGDVRSGNRPGRLSRRRDRGFGRRLPVENHGHAGAESAISRSRLPTWRGLPES